MLDVFAAYATDEVKENKGVRVELGGDAWMVVARLNNPAYTKLLLAESEKHEQSLKILPAEEAQALDSRILREVMAETILLDFGGISWKGKELKYSKKTAMQLLELKDFQRRVMREAENIENFRLAKNEADGGN